MIAFEDVFMSYPTRFGRKVVLETLNLVMDTSKSIGILGLNGAGKSTLLRLIGGDSLFACGVGRVEGQRVEGANDRC